MSDCTRQLSTSPTHQPGHTSTVNRALSIDEITRLILNFLSERRDFLAILLTCKAFHIPALDRLWEVIPNLSPLLRILPKETIDFTVEKSHQGKLVYEHKLLSGPARRVLKLYCRRIKQISALDLKRVDMRTIRAFVGCLGLPLTVESQPRGGSDDLPCLFPNLAKVAISIDPVKPSHGDFLAHLCSPKLAELHIQFIPFYPTSRSFGTSVRADERFSVAGSSRAASASIVAGLEAPTSRQHNITKPISSTDDAEDAQLARAFGEKAYDAAVSIGSPLHTMTIDISESTDGAVMQLESLCAIPSLRDVRVKGDIAPPAQAYAVLRYLGANPALERLSSAPNAGITSSFAIFNAGNFLGEDGWFPALNSFHGYNDSLIRITASSSGCFSNLTQIHITFNAEGPPLEGNGDGLSQRLQIQRFFDFIGSRCHALQDITFQAFWDIDGEEGPISLDKLSNCSQMRRLVFDGPDPAMNPPTDTDIIAMAEAWPLLEFLHWQGAFAARDTPEQQMAWGGSASTSQPYSSNTRPNATLKSLAKLSQLCRHLKEVEIDVDCQDDLGSDDVVEAMPQLERITVWRWNLTSRDVSRTASAIAMLAGPWKPDARLGKAMDWVSSDAYKSSHKIWEEVFVKIDELRGVPDK